MIKSLVEFPLISTLIPGICPLIDGDAIVFQRLTDDPWTTNVIEFLPTPFTELGALHFLRTLEDPLQSSGDTRASAGVLAYDFAARGTCSREPGYTAHLAKLFP